MAEWNPSYGPKPKPGRPAGSKLTAKHKRALGRGVTESFILRRYLVAVEEQRGALTTPIDVAELKHRLVVVERLMATARGMDRLDLAQEQVELRKMIRIAQMTDYTELEDSFVRFAKSWSDRKHISYAAWLTTGVSEDVLQRAGLGP